MKTTRSKTAGKRTARPGSRKTDKKTKSVTSRGKSFPAKAGQRTVGITGRHIGAHSRASAQRKHNPGSKKK